MNTNEAKKALLRENKYALRGLHDVFGYDFMAPHDVMHISGKFTINQVNKLVEKAGYSVRSKTVLLVKVNGRGCWNNELHVVKVMGSGYKVDFRSPYYNNYNNKAFDNYYAKKGFEEARKDDKVEAYIICQENDFLRKKADSPVDREDRYKISCRWTGHYDIVSCTTSKKYDWTLDTYNREHLEDVFDRSGYFVKFKREDLKRRAEKLRAEREKAAYLETENTAKIDNLLRMIDKRKLEIVEQLANATTSAAMKSIEDSVSYFRGLGGILSDFEIFKRKTENKEYPSIAASDAAYNRIMAKLNA